MKYEAQTFVCVRTEVVLEFDIANAAEKDTTVWAI